MHSDIKKLFSLENRVAIITGGAGFLGMQYADTLSKAGAHVVLFDIKDEHTIQGLAKKITDAHGVEALGIRVDITDADAVEKAVTEVKDKFGTVDILINNAAMNPAVGDKHADKLFAPYEQYPIELWRKEVEVNLTGAQICTQAAAPIMMKQRNGVIINKGSEIAVATYDHRAYGEGSGKFKSAAYITTKTSLLGLTRSWASYLAPYGVRVNMFCPVGMQTPAHDKEFVKRYASLNMFGRMAQPGEYNGTMLFLCSDASSFMTGANLIVDGGKTAW
ncbi:MAG: SDR family oxidoreductase [bacterium]|nr:SDR family oxidoreductase [bacterium]